ncbi:MAG TPA: carboxypeptidase-like regulatory domain-containing protein [Planctomycetota bacterium]|nr:carboxypeptidase-like regulatory domain-containing protein [Planctomycetota bacterium]
MGPTHAKTVAWLSVSALAGAVALLGWWSTMDRAAATPPAGVASPGSQPMTAANAPAVEVSPVLHERSATASGSSPLGVGKDAGGPTRLSGIVVTVDDMPVADAQVDLVWRDADSFRNRDPEYAVREQVVAHAVTGTDGRFVFSVARAVPHRVRVRASGCAPVEVQGCIGGREVRVQVDRPGSLVVTVVQKGSGIPLSDAPVSVWPNDSGDEVPLRTGITDGDGRVRFDDLPAGVVLWYMTQPAAFTAARSAQRLRAGQQEHAVLEVQRGMVVRGVVLDAVTRTPIADAQVADERDFARSVRSDALGRFVLRGVAEELQFALHVRADGYARAAQPFAGIPVQRVTIELRRGGSVRGRVVDGDGRARSDAYVAATAREYGMDEDWLRATMAGDGSFLIDGVDSERSYALLVRARGPSGRTMLLPHTPETGEVLDLGDIAVTAGGTLEGVVVGQDGLPLLAGVSIVKSDDGTQQESATLLTERGTESDASGRFCFAGLDAGVYDLHACVRGRMWSHVQRGVELTDGAVREVRITVDLGLSIRGRILQPDGQPFRQVVILRALASPSGASVFADVKPGDGSFCIDGLQPGSYDLFRYAMPFDQFALRPVRGVPAGASDVVLQLTAMATITGKVLAHDGEPARSLVTASFGGVDSEARAAAETDAEGRFVLEAPPGERYTIEAWVPDRTARSVRAENVEAGRGDLELRLPAPSRR